jgi:hypothetical protein
MSQINLLGGGFFYMKFDTQIKYSSASTHTKGFPPTFFTVHDIWPWHWSLSPIEAVISVTLTYPVPRSMRPLAIPSTRCSSACCCSTFAMGTPLREMRGVCTSLLESSTRAPPTYRARIFKLFKEPKYRFPQGTNSLAGRYYCTKPYSYSVPSPHRLFKNSSTEVQNVIEFKPELTSKEKN